jgi:hypothetical protein
LTSGSNADTSVCARARSGERGRYRLAAQLVEPSQLLVGAFGDEARREYLAERGIVAAPPLGKVDDGLEHLVRSPIGAACRAERKPAAQDDALHPLGVARGIGDTHRRAMRHAKQRERPRQPRRFDDAMQILDPSLDR